MVPLRWRIERVVACFTVATTTVYSSSWSWLRSVVVAGSMYRRGRKARKSATSSSPRDCFSLAAVGPRMFLSRVDGSATSLDPEQQRVRRLTAVDDADLDLAVSRLRRSRHAGRHLRVTVGPADHGQQLPSVGQEPANHVGAVLTQIFAD